MKMSVTTAKEKAARETSTPPQRASSAGRKGLAIPSPAYHLDSPGNERTGHAARKGEKSGLPGTLRAGAERLSGYSMDDVTVHYNSFKPARFQALAFAQGTHIHVSPGQERHLAHETWHVVQQKQGRVRPTLRVRGTKVNDDVRLEREAHVMGRRLAESQRNVGEIVGSKSRKRAEDSTDAAAQLLTVTYHPNRKNTLVGTASVAESNGAQATVQPTDFNTGSTTAANVRYVSQEASRVFVTPFIAGHMLNNHLGGPGNNQQNITAFTKGQNAAHHSKLEKQAKDAVHYKTQHTIDYYTGITKRADFEDAAGNVLAQNLASELAGAYQDLTTGTTFGPIQISLGPPVPPFVKKRESPTGMPGGLSGPTRTPRDEELAAAVAEGVVHVVYNQHRFAIDASYPALAMLVPKSPGKTGIQEEMEHALFDRIMKSGNPDPEKFGRLATKWAGEVSGAQGYGGATPQFLDTYH